MGPDATECDIAQIFIVECGSVQEVTGGFAGVGEKRKVAESCVDTIWCPPDNESIYLSVSHSQWHTFYPSSSPNFN